LAILPAGLSLDNPLPGMVPLRDCVWNGDISLDESADDPSMAKGCLPRDASISAALPVGRPTLDIWVGSNEWSSSSIVFKPFHHC